MPKQFNRKKEKSLPQVMLEKLEFLYRKKEPQWLSYNISQINLRCVTYLNVKTETIKLLEKTWQKCLLNLGLERFLRENTENTNH